MSQANDNAPFPAAAPDERLLRQISGPLGVLAAAGHTAAALTLIQEFGGTKINLPANAANSALAKRIGNAAAQALIEAAGGGPCNLRIPSATCLTNRKIIAVMDAIETGGTNTKIARELGVSDTYVSRLRKLIMPASSQTSAAGIERLSQ